MREISKGRKRRTCKVCRRKLFKISQHGHCVKCATEKVELARLQIKHKQGPIYERWRNKMLEGLQKE